MTEISLIIPIYNVEQYIGRCMEAVLCQTYKHYEVILVDDGSSDNSLLLATNLLENSADPVPYKVIVHPQNRGVSAARNSGLDAASGNYIYFPDSDDYIEPELLSILHSAAVTTGADVVMCGSRSVFERDAKPPVLDIPAIQGLHTGDEALIALFEGRCRAYLCMQLFSRAAIGDLRFPVGRIYEDRLMLPQIFLRVKKVLFIPDILYNYVQRMGSITKGFRPEIYRTIEGMKELEHLLGPRLQENTWADPFFRYEYLNFQTLVFNAVIHSRNYGEVRSFLSKVRKQIAWKKLWNGYKLMPRPVLSLVMFKLNPFLFRLTLKKYILKKLEK